MDHILVDSHALASSPSTQSSVSDTIETSLDSHFILSAERQSRQHLSFAKLRRPNVSCSHLERLRRLKMAGFLSSEAERALMSEGADHTALWADSSELYMPSGFHTPLVDEAAGWAHAHSDSSGFDYFHPYDPGMSQQYMLPPNPGGGGVPQQSFYNMPTRTMSANVASPMSYSQDSMIGSALPSSGSGSTSQSLASPPMFSAPPYSAAPSRTESRSPSPHMSPDLQSYGRVNSDGRTWRCAYPGCHSKAVFVRPCDLRKHFHRHEKKFFCRHENCPQSEGGTRKSNATVIAFGAEGPYAANSSTQSTQSGLGATGGFSSKKDRARHEAKHNPGVPCDWEGCDRLFSRVDNMKDHYRRIHLKEKERRRLSGRRSDEDQ